jgi:hypothetical protein
MAVLAADGEGWHGGVLDLLRSYSRIWGGAADIIVPVSADGHISRAFWKLLKAYDPDQIGALRLDALAHRAKLYGDASLEVEFRRRLSPSLYGGNVVFNSINPGELVSDRVDIDSFYGVRGKPICTVDASDLHPLLHLMLATRFGSLNEEYVEQERQRKRRLRRYVLPEAELDHALEICWKGYDRPFGSLFSNVLHPQHTHTVPWTDREFGQETALGRTLHGCGYFQMATRPKLPFVTVLGDGMEDFCLALGLDRMLSKAAWLPGTFVGASEATPRAVAAKLATEWSETLRDGVPLYVTSATLSHANLSAAVQSVAALSRFRDSAGLVKEITVVGADQVPLADILRVFDREKADIVRYEPFVGTDMAVQLTPTMPSVSCEPGRALSWQVDVIAARFQPPMRSAISETLVSGELWDQIGVRASSLGITYFSASMGFVPAEARLDQALARPRLRCPEAKEIFSKLLSADGLRLEESAAGRYTRATLEVWGGLDELARDFANPGTASMLEGYRSKEPDAAGIYLDNLERRYLSFEDIKRLSGMDTPTARHAIDAYLNRGILTRGLILQCPECHFSAWYTVSQLGRGFSCPRCRKESPIVQRAWRQPIEEPIWYYELTEMAFQAIDHDVRATILALASLKKGTRAFLFTPEMDVFRGDDGIAEIDIWAVADGRVLVGEAKTTDRLDPSAKRETEKLKKLLTVAQAAFADEVVLATTQSAWRTATEIAAAKTLSSELTTVRFLAGL